MSRTVKPKIKFKTRNPEKVVMDKHYSGSRFKLTKRILEAKELDKEIDNYKEGY
jgi:hypothetical protein|tara:strand:- start:1148 stop:1309 length:162 start_codon:yes stop_codon:yes gene_type:complete